MSNLRYFLFSLWVAAQLSSLWANASAPCGEMGPTRSYEKIVGELDGLEASYLLFLNGKGSSGEVFKNIFDDNYQLEKSEDIIQTLKGEFESGTGWSSTYLDSLECLTSDVTKEQKEAIKLKLKKIQNLLVKIHIENEKQNDGLRTSTLSQLNLPGIINELNQQTVKTQVEKKELEENLIQVGESLDESSKQEDNLLNLYIEKLTKLKIALLDVKLAKNKELEKKVIDFEQQINQLQNLAKNSSQKDLEIIFEKIEVEWEKITKNNFYQLLNTNFKFGLPNIPSIPEEFSDNLSSYQKAQNEKQKAIQLKAKTLIELNEKKEKELALQNSLLIQANSLRTQYFKQLNRKTIFKRIFSKRGFNLLKNEVLSAPYRLISFGYEKYFRVREMLSKGRAGLIEISLLAFKIFALLFSLWGARIVIRKGYAAFNSFQNATFYKFQKYSLVRFSYSIWNKTKENTEIFLWLLIISFSKYLEEAKHYIILLDLVQVLLIAKIIKSFVTIFLGTVSKIDTRNFLQFRQKARETSEKLSNIYLFYALTLIFTHATIGHVYIYSIIKFFVLFYTVFQIMRAASLWQGEFTLFIERKFSGVLVEKINKVLNVFPAKSRSVLVLLAILVLSLIDFLVRLTENFDISKKISANVFKKQIERIEAEEGADDKIPVEYKNHFSLTSLDNDEDYVTVDEKLEESVKGELLEWTDLKSDEHSLVVYGDKGIGKTTFMKHVLHDFKQGKDVEVYYAQVPAKTITKKKLHDFLKQTFQISDSSEKLDLLGYDSKLEKKVVVFIDETQNIFLSRTKGFEAYYDFINLINLNTKNIYWVISFNRYSWLYLDRAFGRNQFFRNVFELKGWNDVKIKELILKRHSKLKYGLSYDLLINATRSQDEIDKYSSIESKFFKLLWELSRGNPRTALYLWLTALSRKNFNNFNVNIPKEYDMSLVGKLSDDLLFVIADILKHENLSTSEVEDTTDLPKGIVRNALKLGYERKFLYQDERGRHMIAVPAQYGLTKYLKLKNFIYGS